MPQPQVERFLEETWKLLREDLELLVPATLTGRRGRVLAGTGGAKQIDADKLRLRASEGVYRCGTCRRAHARSTPNMACMAWQCTGTLAFEEEDPDNYDLMVLDQQFAMVRPREHSAQIPADERERLERAFKGEGEAVNTLVCTPTLELGVDIGALDAVLMRNVPPLPSNYWQRAGRAGRRHRMAVNLTYCRPASHDRAYFADPLRMLEGAILPPRFNLRNEVMIRKHVHATVLTTLRGLARAQGGLTEGDRRELQEALDECFPTYVRDYLFDANGNVRGRAFDVRSLTTVVSKHRDRILGEVRGVFSQGWPEEDANAVADEVLEEYVDGMDGELDRVLRRLRQRLDWALDQMSRLERARARKGTLDPGEKALHARCDRLVARLKGVEARQRGEAAGYDDTYTYSVLAAEGFLPGYGLDTGWVAGYHMAPRYGSDLKDWELRRGAAVALREYVPGNLIYANGHRFVPRYFHLQTGSATGGDQGSRMLSFQVDVGNEAVVELGAAGGGGAGGLGTQALDAVPICDVDLPHFSHISDDEENRFQLPVAIYGHERDRHGAGQAYTWGLRDLQYRRSVHMRLVNVGAASLVRGQGRLGYPVCTVCGQSRSPYSSEREREKFAKEHRERCGRPVEGVGFYADVTADALSLPRCANRTEAFSVLEALRQGAASVLEMEIEDLQLLVTGTTGSDEVTGLLYDPMPGGSGLLEQMLERWGEVLEATLEIVTGCPAKCASSCPDCLQHFRNAYYHRHLDREVATQKLTEWGEELQHSHDIPARLPSRPSEQKPTNMPEETLRIMLEQAGFRDYQAQYEIDLGLSLGTTVPDFYFEDPNEHYEGICVYLDGLSGHLHGNPETQARDRAIREQLRADYYEVFEIAWTELTDRKAMRRYFARLGWILVGRERSRELKDDLSWFEMAPPPDVAGAGEEATSAGSARSPEGAAGREPLDREPHGADERTTYPTPPEGEDISLAERGGGSGSRAVASGAAWSEIVDLLPEDARDLARTLEAAGIPAPSDVEWDLVVEGRVSGEKALMVWHRDDSSVGLVAPEQAPATPPEWVVVLDREDLEATVTALRERLELKPSS